MKNNQTIHTILNSWGKGEQRSPLKNSELKNSLLEKISTESLTNTPYQISKTGIKTPLPWLSLAFASMAVLVFLLTSVDPSSDYQINNIARKVGIPTMPAVMPTSMPSSGAMESIGGAQNESSVSAPDYYYKDVYLEEPPISDKREFLKTNYNSTLRTRDVTDLKTRIEIIVRGFGGRIDGSSSGEKNGYISFAIPEDKFEMFRQEVKSLVGKKLYTEQISSDNLLPQKQSIEEQQLQTEKYLATLKSERTVLVKSHNSTVTSYQGRINAINAEIGTLENERQGATPERKVEISYRISLLQSEKTNIQKQLANENSNYQNRLSSIDYQIKNGEANLEAIKKQDKNLIENVATVNGNISLSWISLWEISDIYTPGPLLAWILLALAVMTYFWHRRYWTLVI